MMKPVDSHCHIDFDRFDEDRDQVIRRASEKLEFFVNAGRGPESNAETVRLSEEHNVIVPNLGLHPTYTDYFDDMEEVKEQIRRHDPPAIGEIGLDHHHIEDEKMRERQEDVFREMLELAEQLGKPVVVHSRDAEKRSFEVLQEYELPGVMLHCFNGTVELAEKAVREGMKVGVTTQALYSARVQDIAERVPLENMLLETDSPFLYRGDRNEPVNVVESAEKISKLKETDVSEVVSQTTKNAEELFSR